jgi:hypothetical protein
MVTQEMMTETGHDGFRFFIADTPERSKKFTGKWSSCGAILWS